MAAYRVQVALLLSTQAKATQVASALADFLASRPRLVTDQEPAVQQDAEGKWTVRADAQFVAQAHATEWWTDIRSKWASGPLASAILTGSRVSIHCCPHDEGAAAQYPCSDLVANFQQAVK